MNRSALNHKCPFCAKKLAGSTSTCPSCHKSLERTENTDINSPEHKHVEYIWYTQNINRYAADRGLDVKQLKIEIQSSKRTGYCENGQWFVRFELASRRRGPNLPLIAASIAVLTTLVIGIIFSKSYSANAVLFDQDRAMMLCKNSIEKKLNTRAIGYVNAQVEQPTKRILQVGYQLEIRAGEKLGRQKSATCVFTHGELSSLNIAVR